MKNITLVKKTETSSVSVPEAEPASDDTTNAHIATGGAFPATLIVNSYLKLKSMDSTTMLSALQDQAQALHRGDMTQVESMLIGQAVALQSMFLDFALRAKEAQSLETIQCLTQLALRSQAGSRSTLQTLAEVKNPRQVAFVKQTNVAQTQQVNNGVIPSRVKNINDKPNELLVEDAHGSTKMDARAKKAASGAYTDLVSVEQVHRPARPRGKVRCVA
jgi:hypothetical protein